MPGLRSDPLRLLVTCNVVRFELRIGDEYRTADVRQLWHFLLMLCLRSTAAPCCVKSCRILSRSQHRAGLRGERNGTWRSVAKARHFDHSSKDRLILNFALRLMRLSKETMIA